MAKEYRKQITSDISVLWFRIMRIFLGTVLSLAVAAGTGIAASTPQIAAGIYHSVALMSDGKVWTWGSNGLGQLGDGTTMAHLAPSKVINLGGITALAAGGYHTLALKSDGTVWAWGCNGNGQLGNGTTIVSIIPIPVPGLNGVIALAAGRDHAVALKNDGTVWAWGFNAYGQLGDGTTIDRHNPVQVTGLSGVRSIVAGSYHSVALKNDGTVWAWGNNDDGQLGDGTTTRARALVQVKDSIDPTGYLTGVNALAAGRDHTVALKNNGTVWAWGGNYYGQLGGTASSLTPVQVTGQSGVIAIAAGYYHTVAMKGGGTVWAWGDNKYGQLGNGVSNSSRVPPVQVTGLSGMTTIAAGEGHSVALKNDGTGRTWGNNYFGQLGDGTTTDRLTPVQVTGFTSAPIPPKVTTAFLSGITKTTATSGGAVIDDDGNPVTDRGVCWSTSPNPTTVDSCTSDGSGMGAFVSFLTGLTPATTYHVRAYAVNSAGTGYGEDLMISTFPLYPKSGIAAGSGHTLTLMSDGTLRAWGANGYGQLGDGTTTDRLAPVKVIVLNGMTAITAGLYHTVALENDGTVWGWGQNWRGELGDGTYGHSQNPAPIQVPGFGGVFAIATGAMHTVALKCDGTVWAWGYNASYQLGVEWYVYYTESHSPIQVTRLNGVKAIAAGYYHSVALKNDGTVWTWGENGSGQLGNGTVTNSPVPIQVPGLSGVTAIFAGNAKTVALKNDGTVWAWGTNVGDGTNTTHLVPVQVAALSGITALSSVGGFTVILKGDGTVWAWGDNEFGQLGDGTTTFSLSPVQVKDPTNPSGFLTGVTAIAAGYAHSVALKSDGSAWGWGDNRNGQLGDGTTTNHLTPVQVTGFTVPPTTPYLITTKVSGISKTTAISGGEVIDDGGAPVTARGCCWGALPNPTIANSCTSNGSGTGAFSSSLTGLTPGSTYHVRAYAVNSAGTGYGEDQVFSTPPLYSKGDIAAGGYHTVALKSNDTVRAWGYNFFGQLGDGTTTDRHAPIPVTGLSGVNSLAAGGHHTAALKSDGTVWVWGYNYFGQLGDGTFTDRYVPVPVPGLNGVIALAAGRDHTVALNNDGTVRAWGYNGYGQLGDDTTTDRHNPVQVTGLSGVIALAAGGDHTVALKNDGTVWTWGSNQYGQLGDVTTTDRHNPVQVTGLSGVIAIAAGYSHTVALKVNGSIHVWGNNTFGQLGDGTTTDRHAPVQVGGLVGGAAIAAGFLHTVALMNDGSVRTWGSNQYGQLGDGTTTNSLAPVPVTGLSGVTAIAAGYHHTAILKGDGTVWTWGSNQYGQLGDMTTTNRHAPIQAMTNLMYLTTILTGTGSGSVHSSPSGIACQSGSCSAHFSPDTSVTLSAAPSFGSFFSGWSDGGCTGINDCTFTLSADMTVSATFTDAPKTMIGSTGYPSLAAAYSAATSSTEIKLLDTGFPESLTMSKTFTITLKGGYNATFTSQSENLTSIQKPLTMKSGTLKVNRVRVK